MPHGLDRLIGAGDTLMLRGLARAVSAGAARAVVAQRLVPTP